MLRFYPTESRLHFFYYATVFVVGMPHSMIQLLLCYSHNTVSKIYT